MLTGQGIGAGQFPKGTSYAHRTRGSGGGRVTLSPYWVGLIGRSYGFGLSASGYAVPLGNGGGLRCHALCRFSVGSPIPTPHPINQNATAGRISCESALRSWAWTGADRVGAVRADGQRGGGRASRTGTASQRNPTATSESPLNAHDPHPTRLHPTLLLARASDP